MVRISGGDIVCAHWRVPLGALALLLAGCAAPVAGSEVGTTSSAVVGGVPIDEATYPATGALIEWLPSGTPLLVCTATLIAPRVVLTAAHCVARSAHMPDFTRVADIANATPAGSVHGRSAHVHPAFDPDATGSLHDIALVELDSPVDGVVATERLLDWGGAATALRVGAGVQLVGYGLTLPDGGLGGAKNAGVGRIATVATDEMTIGGPGEVQNCIGDSGGPSYWVASDGTRRVVGIVSRSANNATECVDGSIQTRVDAYGDWIAATLRTIASDDHGPPAMCTVPSPATNRRSDWWPWATMAGLAVLIVHLRRLQGTRAKL